MASLAMKPKRLPLIAVVGATGTGKSQVRVFINLRSLANHLGSLLLKLRVVSMARSSMATRCNCMRVFPSSPTRCPKTKEMQSRIISSAVLDWKNLLGR